jgi:hypothetical protein
MTPMMKAQSGRPGSDRVAGPEEDRQHDDEDHDEHVRDAGSVRHRGHVGALLAPGEPAGEQRVVHVADDQGDAQRRQHGAEDIGSGELHDEDQQCGQGEHVHQDVERQPEERVQVTPSPPGNLEAIDRVRSGRHCCCQVHDRTPGI